MNIYNSSRNILIADTVKIAESFVTRSVGLLLRKKYSINEALIIKPCCSIHTFFMRINIDVLFVNKNNEIIALYENVKPFRILPIHIKSSYVIELPAHAISQKNISKGDCISFN